MALKAHGKAGIDPELAAQLLRRPSSRRPVEKHYLSANDFEKIMVIFRERNFGDFNNWMQTARAVADYDYAEKLVKGVRDYECTCVVLIIKFSHSGEFIFSRFPSWSHLYPNMKLKRVE